jgi:hypothetical protein
MIYFLSVSIVLLFLLVVLSAWRSGFRHWSLWIIIPFVIFNLGFSWHTIESLKGYPYANYPPADHQLLFSAIAKPKIYLLTIGNNEKPRLYVIDYTDEMAKKLAQAKQKMDQGQLVMTHRGDRTIKNNSLEFYIFDLEKKHPKN